MEIRNWYFVFSQKKPDSYIVTGNVYGHPRFENGELIRTSEVISFNVDIMMIHTKSGVSYELTAIDPEFASDLKRERKCLRDFHNP